MTKQDNNKDKLRVYEYAKSLNMSSKEIITILKRLGRPVNNHMSVMENDAVDSVEKFFKDVKANAAAKRSENNAVPASNKTVAVTPKPEQRSGQESAPARSSEGSQESRPAAERSEGGASRGGQGGSGGGQGGGGYRGGQGGGGQGGGGYRGGQGGSGGGQGGGGYRGGQGGGGYRGGQGGSSGGGQGGSSGGGQGG
ncbi:translation initiation factor IF-2 N-terminal domain-containing protein, partial [Paenibacillus mucilaginosus]